MDSPAVAGTRSVPHPEPEPTAGIEPEPSAGAAPATGHEGGARAGAGAAGPGVGVAVGTSATAEAGATAGTDAGAGGSPLPNISDYWPDAPQRLGPEADHYEVPGAEPARTAPAWHTLAGADPAGPPAGGYRSPPGRPVGDRPTVEIPVGTRPLWRSALVLAALLTVGATVAYVLLRPASESPAPPTFATGAPSAATGAPSAAAGNPPVAIDPAPPSEPPVVVPEAATFEFVDNTTEINVTIGTVTGGWFRVTAPRDSGVEPSTEVDGTTLRVGIRPTGSKGSGRVDVLLSEDVDWTVRTRGGFRTATLDLAGGAVERVDLLGGVARLDLALPRLRTKLPIVLAGGVNRWRITTDGEVPVRAAFRRGAGAVTLYGDRDRGVKRGSEVSVGSGSGGMDINAEDGVGALTVVAR